MSFSPSSPITGGAQTGFTSPTYTLTNDVPAPGAAKSYVVSALGGTQAGVTTHTIGRPFTLSFFGSQNLVVPVPDLTGVVRNVPRNVYQAIVRAGAMPLAGQANQVAILRFRAEIPAGADTADAAQLRAAMSLLAGVLMQQSAGIGDTFITGVP